MVLPTNPKKLRPILHHEFAQRMAQACDGNPDVPPPNYGRLGWFVVQIEKRFNETVTQETIRKWFAGESRPRHKMMAYLAQILKVDEAWLSIGRSAEISTKQHRALNATVDGAVNVVAGFVRMCGGHPAFPREDDARAKEQKIDIYAIIKGAQYAFHIVTGQRGEQGWKVLIPVDVSDVFVIAVLPVTDLHCEFVELDWEGIEAEGTRKSGMFEVIVPFEESGSRWRHIKTFAERI